jgi:hypothetical protein
MRWLALLLALAACGKKGAQAPRSEGCDPTGSWELKLVWEDGACPGAETPWELPVLLELTKGAKGRIDFTGGSAWGHTPILVAGVDLAPGCRLKIAADSDTREDPPSWVTMEVDVATGEGVATLKRAECEKVPSAPPGTSSLSI